MEYLQKEDILLINQKTIERHGGNYVPPDNLLKPEPLDYLLEVVNAVLFGKELYPKIQDKAGLYMYTIISDHIFQDGNKRTGLEAALLFLRLNGYQLSENLTRIIYKNEGIIMGNLYKSKEEVLIEFTLEVAQGNYTLEECQYWFLQNTDSI